MKFGLLVHSKIYSEQFTFGEMITNGGINKHMQKKCKPLKALASESVKSLIELKYAVPSHTYVSAKSTDPQHAQVLQKLMFNKLHVGHALSQEYVRCVSESVAYESSRLTNELLFHFVAFTEKVITQNGLELENSKATCSIKADYEYDSKRKQGILGSKEPCEVKISLNIPFGKDAISKSMNSRGILSFIQIALPFAFASDSGEVVAVTRTEGIWRLDFEFNLNINWIAYLLKKPEDLLTYCQDDSAKITMMRWHRQIERLKNLGETSQRTEYKFVVNTGELIDADESVHTCDRLHFDAKKIGHW
ncbi:hypothetical protein [Lysinibacillus fusiformis]|uniref:hypothetical protein n=1 Tax=Lysinibacillus fusiformis TaxID=28031 RepID=UPI00371CD301